MSDIFSLLGFGMQNCFSFAPSGFLSVQSMMPLSTSFGSQGRRIVAGAIIIRPRL